MLSRLIKQKEMLAYKRIYVLVSLIFATHRATCKAIKTAADLFMRIRDYKGVCNVRQCVFYFIDREISQKTLVKANQL